MFMENPDKVIHPGQHTIVRVQAILSFGANREMLNLAARRRNEHTLGTKRPTRCLLQAQSLCDGDCFGK